MKILQILPELKIGGVERGTVDLARELLRRGHQALVVSNGGNLVKELESFGARHIQLPVHRKCLFTILACIPKLAKLLQQEKVDIVHARSRIPALIGFFGCWGTGAKFVTTCHGYYSHNFFSRVMGWGRCVIVASRAIARHMIEDFEVPKERIRFIPRGVDLREFKFPERKDRRKNTFTIGVIGRLTPIKGHKYFLEALAKVTRAFPKVHALIVGEISPGKEDYKEELKMLTRRLSLDKYVEFIGREDDVPRVLSRLDVLVLPTVTQEAFGRVLIEAAACGVPTIATKVGGVVDVIKDGVTGILVSPEDSSAIASAITRLFDDSVFAARLASAARKNVEENFSLEQMAEKTINVYKEVQKSFRILVIKVSALGDLILAVPSLRALREKFPAAHIALLTQKSYRSVLQRCPYIDEILEFPSKFKGYRNVWREASLLRKAGFDIVIDLQNNRKSHILSFLSGCSMRYGYDNGKFSFLLNKKVKEASSALSPVKHQARTLGLLGIEFVTEELELWPSDDDEAWARDFIGRHRRNKSASLIGVNLGSSTAWPSKRWPQEKFAALLDKLNDAGMEVVVTGKGKDKRLIKKLSRLCKNPFIDAVDQSSIMQLGCLIKRCSVYISCDTAPLHLAYAMKTPAVALFGPTDSRRHTMDGAEQIVINKYLACSPCYRRRCRDHSCMKEITVEEVFKAVKKLL